MSQGAGDLCVAPLLQAAFEAVQGDGAFPLSGQLNQAVADIAAFYFAGDAATDEIEGQGNQRLVEAAEDGAVGVEVVAGEQVIIFDGADAALGGAFVCVNVVDPLLRESHDRLGATVCRGQRQARGVEIRGDLVEAVGIGAGEPVDCLGAVSNGHNAAAGGEKGTHKGAAGWVGVLGFVNEDPGEFPEAHF